MAPISQRSWSSPSLATFIVPPLVLTLQAALLVPGQPLPYPRLIRKATLPLALCAIWTYMDSAYLEPRREFILFNLVIHIAKAWAMFRSMEFALAGGPYTWIGYEAAYTEPASKEEEMVKVKRQEEVQAGQSKSILDAFWLGWCIVTSYRGVGWHWGIRGSQIPQPHPQGRALVPSLLLRIVWTHYLTAASVAFATLCRQRGSAGAIFQDLLGTTRYPTPVHELGEIANVYAFGAAIYACLECGFAQLTLVDYLLTLLLRAVLPQSIRPAPFDARGWPRISNKPYRSTSLHEFWGRRWHSVFKRVFAFVGGEGASKAVEAFGLGKQAQRAIGVMGAFAVSGIMHESYNHATPWYPRDPLYLTFVFFFIQSFGLIAESVFTKSTGKRVSGPLGMLWTFGFLLYTGRMMKDTWVDRGLADFLPPVAQWEWWRWHAPFGFIFPSLSLNKTWMS